MTVTQISRQEEKEIFQHGEAPGLTVARLGEVGGSKWPDRPLQPTVPFTLLPPKLFDTHRWLDLRTVVKLLRRIASWPQLRDSWVISLQDNKPTACSMAKGRSPSFALNRILRQKSAVCIASGLRLFLPWVESCKQPADHLSRIW